jgi:hypothetical protein
MRSPLLTAFAVAAFALAFAPAATSTAAQDITLFARPLLAAPQGGVTLYGSIPGGRVGESIEIEARDCGQRTFHAAGGAHAGVSGEWQTEFFPGITTTVRAVWRGKLSREVTIRQRASVRLEPHPASARRFQVAVAAKTSFWRKHVLFQRLAGTWTTVRPIVLTESSAPPGATYVWSRAEFRTTLPKGARVRVLLPQREAGPCYLSAASRLLRVG